MRAMRSSSKTLQAGSEEDREGITYPYGKGKDEKKSSMIAQTEGRDNIIYEYQQNYHLRRSDPFKNLPFRYRVVNNVRETRCAVGGSVSPRKRNNRRRDNRRVFEKETHILSRQLDHDFEGGTGSHSKRRLSQKGRSSLPRGKEIETLKDVVQNARNAPKPQTPPQPKQPPHPPTPQKNPNTKNHPPKKNQQPKNQQTTSPQPPPTKKISRNPSWRTSTLTPKGKTGGVKSN